MIGHLYIVNNEEEHGLNCFKVGFTNDLKRRLDDFNSATTTIGEYKLQGYIITKDVEEVEKKVHKSLNSYRVRRDREFFRCSLSIINNAILGVTKGHEKNLELNGVGFKVAQKGDQLNLKLGFSHDAIYNVPKGISIKIEKQTKINISGTDKALVSKVASEIKSLKPVEPYKGKGIKEKDQFVIRKEGKKK